MNLENEISAQPTVQTNREVITTNGCKVTLEFSPQSNPQVKHDIAEMLLGILREKERDFMKRVLCLYRVSTKGQVDPKDDLPMQQA